MTGVPQPESLQQRILHLLAQVDELSEELERAKNLPRSATIAGQHKRPQLRLIKGGAVVGAAWVWVQEHTAMTAAAIIIGSVSGGTGLVVGSTIAPADAEPRIAQIQPYQGEPYEGATSEDFETSRPTSPPQRSSGVTPLPSVPPGSSATPKGAGPVSSPPLAVTATPPRDVAPLDTPAPLPTLKVEPPPLTPTVSPAPTPSPEPSPSPSQTVEPEPDPVEEIQQGRSTVVLECVGEPGGEPPNGQEVVACVDELLASV